MRTIELINEAEKLSLLGDFDTAIAKLNHALVLEPGSIVVKKYLLDILIHQNKTLEALDLVTDILKVEENDIDLLFIKANCLNDLEKLDESLELYNRIISVQDNFYLSYGARGIVYHKLGKKEQALSDFNYSLENEKTNAILYNLRALLHIDYENFDLALNDLNRALKLDKKYNEARINRAFVLRMIGKKRKALKDVEKLGSETELNAEGYLQKGIVYFKNNDNQNALEYHNLAIDSDPNLVEAIYSRALVYCNLEEYRKAIEDLDRTMKLDNSHFMEFLLNGYAYIYFKMKDYNQAIKYAEKTLKDYPNFYWSNLTLAEIYGELDNTELFFKNLQIAINGGIGIHDIDENVRIKYAKDKEFRRLTKNIKQYGPYG